MRRLTTEKFIEKARLKHGDKYDYSLVEYMTFLDKVKIICPVHRIFEQKVYNHLGNCGCKKCGFEKQARTKSLTLRQFISKAIQTHGAIYDYSLVEYVNAQKHVDIICKKCNKVFSQTPNHHLSGQRCNHCFSFKRKSNDQFIEECKLAHGDKYDYSLVKYKGNKKDVTIICPKHREFNQKPTVHTIMKCGCPICKNEKIGDGFRHNRNIFIAFARKIHGNKYDYSKVEYINNRTNVSIICPTHGEFKQSPVSHTHAECGCPRCKETTGERAICNYLKGININHLKEKRINVSKYNYCRKTFIVDFYLKYENKKYIIEYNGIQHYENVSMFHRGQSSLEKQQQRDSDLRDYCSRNDITLIEIPYWDYDNIETILNKWFKNEI